MFHQVLTCHAGNREAEIESLRRLGPGTLELEEALTLSHGFSGLLYRHVSGSARAIIGYTLLAVRPLSDGELRRQHG